MIIAVDFDGTVVEHEYPEIGPDVLNAATWLRAFVQAGAQIILWTMRCDAKHCGPMRSKAVKWFTDRDIPLLGVNENPTQHTWTSSPKVYAQVYIDDAAFGCPLRENPRLGGRPFADWDIIGPKILERIISGSGVALSPKIQVPATASALSENTA